MSVQILLIAYLIAKIEKPMAISYKILWKLLIDKDMKKKDLQQFAGISSASITKLVKNENVNTEIIEKICVALQCDIRDIMEITEDESMMNCEGKIWRNLKLFSRLNLT